MNLGILPLTNIPKRPGSFSTLLVAESLAALFICLGLPISLAASRYYRREFLRKTLE
jgi:hypothetical protein